MTSTPSQLRVGIVGLGRMGQRHLAVARQLEMQIAGLVDISSQAIDAASVMCPGDAPQAFADANAMIDALDLDALIVATTAPFHAAPVIRAAEKGVKYILSEKPMAISIAECEAMIAACAANGTVLGVNHQMRFMDQYTKVRELIGTPELGELSSIVVTGSNFGLSMNASHYFEMFRYLTGQPVEEISAWLENEQIENPRGPQFSDASGRLMARNAAGHGLSIDFSVRSGWGLRVCYICRNGQIQVDEISGRLEVWAREGQYREMPTSRYGMPVTYAERAIEPADSIVPTRAVWEAMIAGANYPNGEDGLHSLRCMVSAHLSHEKGSARVALSATDAVRAREFAWA
tara:strand:+ start:1738 stop:2775 length:1038 start_codon:yes stop_codon:yes gene_type:complete